MAGMKPGLPEQHDPLFFHHPGDLLALLPDDGLRPLAWRILRNRVYRDLVLDVPTLVTELEEHQAFRTVGDAWKKTFRILEDRLSLMDLTFKQRLDSTNGDTTRLLLETRSGRPVETVIMRHRGRSTVCLSSQSGCVLGCRFCATASLGAGVNLGRHEILSQVLLAASILATEGRTLRNAVFMGMGEPLLNWEEVRETIKVLVSGQGFQMAWRRITVSTAGLVPGIRQLAREMPGIGLAISLHAPEDSTRRLIMPVADRWPLGELMQALGEFESLSGQPVWYEYLLIKGVNDGPDRAHALAALLKGHRAEVNIIPWNPVDLPATRDFHAPDMGEAEAFRDILKASGIPSTVRRTMGQDIDAACGQLAAGIKPLFTSSP